jgi:hypothetical protein
MELKKRCTGFPGRKYPSFGGITEARPEIFQARLRYFLKMTAQNKRYGQINDSEKTSRSGDLKSPLLEACRHATLK